MSSLNITPLSTACVTIDRYADYIPVVSTVTNLIGLFSKYVIAPRLAHADLSQSHLLTYLEFKSPERALLLLIPGLGNFFVLCYDCYNYVMAEISTEKGDIAEAKKQPEVAHAHYVWAAQRGSIQANFHLGFRLLVPYKKFQNGAWEKPETNPAAKPYFRFAAAYGHGEANARLTYIA